MQKTRIILITYMLILISPYFVMQLPDNKKFEEKRQTYIKQHGNDHGYYGDCSGFSWLIPIAGKVYATPFFLWSLTLAFIAKPPVKNNHIMQLVLIGVVGIIPVLALLLFWISAKMGWFL